MPLTAYPPLGDDDPNNRKHRESRPFSPDLPPETTSMFRTCGALSTSSVRNANPAMLTMWSLAVLDPQSALGSWSWGRQGW